MPNRKRNKHARERKARTEQQRALSQANQKSPPTQATKHNLVEIEHSKMSAQPSGEEEKSGDRKSMLSIERGQLAFNGILALCAAIGILFGKRQLDSIDRQIGLATTATQQTEKVIEQMQRDQRPWINITTAATMAPETQDALEWTFSLENVGHSPGHILETKRFSKIALAPWPYAMILGTPFDKAIEEEAASDDGWQKMTSFLVPGEECTHGGAQPGNQRAISGKERVREGKECEVFVVIVRYRGQNKEKFESRRDFYYSPIFNRFINRGIHDYAK